MGILFAALVGAIVWNLITWYFGLPSSSSHALFGGLVGAALAGGTAVHWSGVLDKVVIPMFLSPVVGFVARLPGDGRDPVALPEAPTRTRPSAGFRIAQTVSAAGMALGHGLQDAQKTMGVVVMALVIAGHQDAATRSRSGSSSLCAADALARHVRGRLAHHADARAARSSSWTRRRASRRRRPARRSCTPRRSSSRRRSPRRM